MQGVSLLTNFMRRDLTADAPASVSPMPWEWLEYESRGDMKNAIEETGTEKELIDPSSQFSSPSDILRHPSLKPEVKREILCQWEADERQLLVAENEGMAGAKESRLDEIGRAIAQLRENSPPRLLTSEDSHGERTTEGRAHLSGLPARPADGHRFVLRIPGQGRTLRKGGSHAAI